MGSTIFWVIVGALALYMVWCWIRNRFFPDNFDHLKRQAEQAFSRDKPVEKKKTAAPPVQAPTSQFTAEAEPTPLYGTKVTVRQAYLRTKKHVADALAARREHSYQLAEEHARKALDEVEKELKRDHWYTPEVLNTLGCILYDQSRNAEARAIWEEAEQIALEWHEQCEYLMPTLENNLKLVKKRMGF